MVGCIESFLSGAAYSVGASRPIEDLEATGNIDRETGNLLRSRGLQRYCDDQRRPHVACLAAISETLESVSLTASHIEAVVFANSGGPWTSAQEVDLLAGLAKAGFERKYIIGLNMQGCSAFSSALQMAANMFSGSSIKNVLVVVFGYANGPAERLGPATVFSDGAAACVVSAERGTFRILVSRTSTNPCLAGLNTGDPKLLTASYKDLRQLIASVLDQAGVASADLQAVFGSNTNLGSLELVADATGVRDEIVYKRDLSNLGHVFACDNLIGLTNYCRSSNVRAGEHFLLLSWSPYVVGATVLCARV
jgi:3-oxoacyl-[acyl-carrier-protein] synthase-3